MAGPWEKYGAQAAPAQQSSAPPAFIPGQVSPTKQAAEARAQAGEQRDVVRTGIAQRGENRQASNDAFGRVDKLAERYNKLPEVKSYRVAIQQMDQALHTGAGAQADLALTYAFAKAMDPDSVVRESEQGMVTSSQPWFQAKVEQIQKQFGANEHGEFSPTARRALRQQIRNSVDARNQIYTQQRRYFTEMARRNQIDPYEVVGDHDGKPYYQRFRQYDQAQSAGQRPQAAKSVPASNGWGQAKVVE